MADQPLGAVRRLHREGGHMRQVARELRGHLGREVIGDVVHQD
jgi:hypothetical protein